MKATLTAKMETKLPLEEPPAYEQAPPAYSTDYGQTSFALADQSPIETKDPNHPPDYPTSSLPCYPTFGLPPVSKFPVAPQGDVVVKDQGQNDGVPQSFGMQIALACIATWLCVFPIGLAAFIFALLARDRSSRAATPRLAHSPVPPSECPSPA